jgi:hypothetical protein
MKMGFMSVFCITEPLEQDGYRQLSSGVRVLAKVFFNIAGLEAPKLARRGKKLSAQAGSKSELRSSSHALYYDRLIRFPGCGEKTWEGSSQIGFTLPAQNRRVNMKVVHQHLDPSLDRFRDHFSISQVVGAE